MAINETEKLRKLHQKKHSEILDLCIAIANAHVTYVNCQECNSPNEIQSYFYTGLVKVECSNCDEELDLIKLLNVKPDIKFMKWVSKRVPQGDEDRIKIIKNSWTSADADVSSLLEGIEKYTQPDGTIDFSRFRE